MTPKRFVGVKLDQDLVAGLDVLRARHGTPWSEAIRRALRAYLERQGVIRKTARAVRATPRTRA